MPSSADPRAKSSARTAYRHHTAQRHIRSVPITPIPEPLRLARALTCDDVGSRRTTKSRRRTRSSALSAGSSFSSTWGRPMARLWTTPTSMNIEATPLSSLPSLLSDLPLSTSSRSSRIEPRARSWSKMPRELARQRALQSALEFAIQHSTRAEDFPAA